MGCFDFKDLPILRSFVGLKKEDLVYTEKDGIGEVLDLYKEDQIIVAFRSGRKRLAADDSEVGKIPNDIRNVKNKKTSSV